LAQPIQPKVKFLTGPNPTRRPGKNRDRT